MIRIVCSSRKSFLVEPGDRLRIRRHRYRDAGRGRLELVEQSEEIITAADVVPDDVLMNVGRIVAVERVER